MLRYEPASSPQVLRTKMIVKLCEGTDGELRRVVADLLPSWDGTDADVLLSAARELL
jgi:hypothetical protein